MPATSPRYAGKITTWKDEQGFGFITPNGGGATVFVHIKSFSGKRKRPALNDIVTYELAVNEKGQQRAGNVAFFRPGSTRQASAGSAGAALLIAAGFIGCLGLLVLIGRLPLLVPAWYLSISVIAHLVYASDKAAACRNAWRRPENTLHLLALIGGWPGALVAQHRLRHKNAKRSFQVTYWLTVVLNCGGLAWLLTPEGHRSIAVLFGTAPSI